MQLKTYQEIAIKELLEKSKKLLPHSGKKLVFKSPTGSGKTVMMAEFLKRLVNDKGLRQPLSFIWTAPRHLHEQSKKRLEEFFEDSRALHCSFFEDLTDRKIDENEILFFNWESINKKDNVYIRENEQENNLSRILERTRGEGRRVLLIVDESHYSAGQMDEKEKSAATRLRDDIGADLTIEVSATPLLTGDESVNVQIEDVKAEGVIKKGVVLNEDFKNTIEKGKIKTDLAGGSEALVLKQAMKKRAELAAAYKKEGVDINPLVLIQLPDRKGSSEDRLRERVEQILKDEHGITIEKGNNKLAVWLSGEHVNKEDLERNDNGVEVLIFKQAPALGWDCPRAQILVLFREWHSQVFSIQTVGRIMRMPEPDKGYYENDLLNYAYVYTNLNDIDIQEDIARKYITIYTSKRIKKYAPIYLMSYHTVRHREKTRLSPEFVDIFLKAAEDLCLSKKINKKEKHTSQTLISDWYTENINLAGAGMVRAATAQYAVGNKDLQRYFDFFVRRSLRHFYPEDRTVGRVKTAIYKFSKHELKMDYEQEWEPLVRIILSETNAEHIAHTIAEAEKRYIERATDREKELEVDEKWEVPEAIKYGDKHIEQKVGKSIIQPFFVSWDSGAEEKLVDFFEKRNNQVEWWFRNGDRDATFFAVPYEDGDQKPFYVDFIVRMKDGRIGLFDPHGTHLSDFGPKADGLYKYIQSENKKGKNLFGGIVANTDPRNYTGQWVYFDKPGKEFQRGSFENWNDLEV